MALCARRPLFLPFEENINVQYYIIYIIYIIYIANEVVTTVSLVTIWHCTRLLWYYWLHSLCCTLHPCDLLLLYLGFCTSCSLSPFLPFLAGNNELVLYALESASVLFCFIDCTYKWNHKVLVLLCLIPFVVNVVNRSRPGSDSLSLLTVGTRLDCASVSPEPLHRTWHIVSRWLSIFCPCLPSWVISTLKIKSI